MNNININAQNERRDIMKGIDVSSYQGTIDWNKVKWAGVQYAIIKIIRKDLPRQDLRAELEGLHRSRNADSGCI